MKSQNVNDVHSGAHKDGKVKRIGLILTIIYLWKRVMADKRIC